MAPGMRKSTREGMRSPGYHTFCSQPAASDVLARMIMGLKPRPYSAVQTPDFVVLTTNSTGVVPMYSPLSSMTRPEGQLRITIVLTGSAVLTSGSGPEAQAAKRRNRRRSPRGMRGIEQKEAKEQRGLCVISLGRVWRTGAKR